MKNKMITLSLLALASSNLFGQDQPENDCIPEADAKVIYVERCSSEQKPKEVVKWKTKTEYKTAWKTREVEKKVTVIERKPFYRPHTISVLMGGPSKVFSEKEITWNTDKRIYPIMGAMYQYSFNDRLSAGVSITSDKFVTGIAGYSFGGE